MLRKKASIVNHIFKAVIFLVLLLAVLHGVSYLVMPKAEVRLSKTRSHESMRVFDEPDNSLDVLFFGHSGVYSAISPMELYKDFGFTSYVCSQPAQLPWESAQWLRALLKVQSPKLVVFEVDHLFYDKGTTVLGNSFKHLVDGAFPVFKNHTGWKDWFTRRPKHERSANKGFYYNTSVRPYTGKKKFTETDKVYKIGKKHMDALEQVYTLCKENGIELMLLEVPSAVMWDYTRFNAVKYYAQKRGLDFIDLNQHFEELKFSWKTDTRDKGDHLNYSGALKVCGYIGRHMKEKYNLADRRDDPKYATWKEDLQRYEKLVKGEKK